MYANRPWQKKKLKMFSNALHDIFHTHYAMKLTKPTKAEKKNAKLSKIGL